MEISSIKNFIKPLYIEIKKKKVKNNLSYNEIIEYDSYIELENLV
jgi:hypothetical protein